MGRDLGDITFLVDTDFEIRTLAKGDAGGGDDDEPRGTRWVKGLASTSDKDEDDESILQRGLDFSYFLKSGWFNYDHDRDDVIGHPVAASLGKGGLLCEGPLFEGRKSADRIWEIARAIKKARSNRRLGMSIEGKILERDGKKILKAKVYNTALTPHPVNTGATFEAFLKSLHGRADDATMKALEVSYAQTDQTGGQAVVPQSLDAGIHVTDYVPESCRGLTGIALAACKRILDSKSIPESDAVTFIMLTKGVSRARASKIVRSVLSGS